jgi:hypothetical membrane protein
MGRVRVTRWVGVAGLVALLAGAVLVGWLHVLEPQVDPVRRTISEYALREHAWVFNLAVLAVVAGSAATLAGLVRARLVRLGSFGGVALGLWCVGLAGVVLFPKHNWARGPSMSGDVHRMLSLVAFVSLPLAALAIGWAWRRTGWGRGAVALGALSLLAFVPIPAAVLIAGATGQRWWTVIPLGAVERLLALVETVTVLALAAWATARPGPAGPQWTNGQPAESQPSRLMPSLDELSSA